MKRYLQNIHGCEGIASLVLVPAWRLSGAWNSDKVDIERNGTVRPSKTHFPRSLPLASFPSCTRDAGVAPLPVFRLIRNVSSNCRAYSKVSKEFDAMVWILGHLYLLEAP